MVYYFKVSYFIKVLVRARALRPSIMSYINMSLYTRP